MTARRPGSRSTLPGPKRFLWALLLLGVVAASLVAGSVTGLAPTRGPPSPSGGPAPTERLLPSVESVVSGTVVADVDGYGTAPLMAGANVTAYNATCTTARPLPDTCPLVNWTTTGATGSYDLSLASGTYYIAVQPDAAITGGAYPDGFGGASTRVGVTGPRIVNLVVYPEVPYDNSTVVLPGYVCDYQYLDDDGTGGPGCQNPVLSWTQDGAYYLNATDELVFYSFVNQTVYSIASWTPLYQRFPGYSMIPNELFITQDGSYVYSWGTLSRGSHVVTAEAVNVTTHRVFLYSFSGFTTSAVAANGQVQLTGWDGNDSHLTIILANASVYDHDLWGTGQSFVAKLGYFEANNVYWEPYLNGYVNAQAAGSTSDGVEEWQLTGPTNDSLVRTYVGHWGNGRIINGLNGIALNLTNHTLSFALGSTGGGNTVVADFNDSGTITGFATALESLPGVVQLGPGAASDRPSLLTDGPALQGYYRGLDNASWLVQMTPGHLGYETTNLTGAYEYGGNPPEYAWSQWSQEGQFYNASYLIAPNSYACDRQFQDACTINGTGGAVVGTVWWYWRSGLPELPFPATAPTACLVPPPTTLVTVANVTSSSISLNWSTPGATGILGYTLEWGTNTSYGHSVGFPDSTESYTITGLPSDVPVYFSVEAWNLHYHGMSAGATSSVTGGPPAPTGLAFAANTTTTIRWNWTQSTGTGILNNTLYVFAGGVCGGAAQAFSTGGPAATGTAGGLEAGTLYSADVTAWNASGESSPSGCAAGMTLPASALVTFSQSGLPIGDRWYVNVTAGPSLNASGAAPTLAVTLPNGAYQFEVATNDKTFAPSYSSEFTVSGRPVSVPVRFSPYLLAIRLSETGLPASTVWNVTVAMDARSSTTGLVEFNETNGTYPYWITDIPGWHQQTLPYSGWIVVEGANVTEPPLVFAAFTYAVTFSEAGLANGTAWSVFVNQTEFHSAGPSLRLELPNGTYPFRLGSVGGYRASPVNGTVKVDGGNVSEFLNFTAQPTTSYLGEEEAAVAGGGVVAAVAIGLLVWRRRRRSAAAPRVAGQPPGPG